MQIPLGILPPKCSRMQNEKKKRENHHTFLRTIISEKKMEISIRLEIIIIIFNLCLENKIKGMSSYRYCTEL